MLELLTETPDADQLLALAPEELGAKLLFLLRHRGERMFVPVNLDIPTTSGRMLALLLLRHGRGFSHKVLLSQKAGVTARTVGDG
jgi:hypothetical protein